LRTAIGVTKALFGTVFPVFSLMIREVRTETGSLVTARTAKQSLALVVTAGGKAIHAHYQALAA
jgi:hypothetical protein